jgi:hypothetical protein
MIIVIGVRGGGEDFARRSHTHAHGHWQFGRAYRAF